MSSWSLEHIPAGAPASAVTKSLDEWGYLSAKLQFVNWGVDTLSITIGGATAATDAPLFGYLDQLVVWRDGVRVFRGWITGAPVQAEAAAEARTYTAAGAAWWLQFYPFHWYMSPEEETVADPANRHAWRWLDYAMSSAINGGAPLAVRADGLSFATLTAPCPDLRPSASCAEVVARASRLHPLSAGWWDYSGVTAVAVAAARAGLTAQSVALGAYGSTIDLTPRPDLRLASVRLAYSYPNPTAGWPDVVDYDDAGTDPSTLGPNRLHVAIGVDDAQSSADARAFGVAGLIYTALKDLVWEGTLTLIEAAAALPILRPGYALSITGGPAGWESMATVVQSVTYSLTPEVSDTCTIALGAPEHLGPQDFLELARAGYQSGGAGGGNPSPWDPPTPPPSDDPTTPGSYDDLNNSGLGGAPVGSISVEARGGNWSLCGFAPYSGSELVRYRRKALSGSATNGSWSMSLSGATVHDPDNACRQSTTGQITRSGSSLGMDCGVSEGTSSQGDLPAQACLPSDQIVSATRRIIPSGETPYGHVASTMAAVLEDPDTPDTAISRLLDAEPEWTAGVTAIRTVPTSGITGVYRELRYRTEHTEGTGESAVTYPTLTGLAQWWRYRLTVTLERRPVDEAGNATGAWAPAGTREHYFIADLDGDGGVDWQTVAPEPGYELRVASTTVEAA